MVSLKLGLLADTSIQLSNLEAIVSSANTGSGQVGKVKFEIVKAMLTRGDNLANWPEVDVWVVRIGSEDANSRKFIDHLDSLDLPVIFDEADSYSSLDIAERGRRFSKKIESCGLAPQASGLNLHRAKYVWILAASAGGPPAVCEFLKAVPDGLENVALVYVQHMEETMSDAITKSLQRNSNWNVVYCRRSCTIYEKSIYIISPSYQLEISEGGTLSPTQTPWPGPYRPSVDQVIAKIWRCYKKDSGVIVFSGMGDDGAKTCRMIKNAGGQVWVQSPETCAVDSMPTEVLNTQCVSYTGSPQQLARHFSAYQKGLSYES